MLDIKQLKLGYQNTVVAQLTELTVPQGGQLLITGSSGSGKTTLLYAIAGLLPVIEGQIHINGTDITRLGEAARDRFRGRHIGVIYQTLHLVRSLTVLQNLLLAPYTAQLPQDSTRAVNILDRLGLGAILHRLPSDISQGQAQRVAIARAMLHKPALILADEPTSSLDDAACTAVIALLKEIAAEHNTTLIIATHDQRVKAHFDMVLNMEAKS